MTDVHNAQQRSYNMSRIRGKDTKPEMIVRSLIHRMGFRFRLHRKDLPGKPDVVLPRHRKVILVHGCFWHLHRCRFGRVVPKTNTEFWQEKRQGTVARDKRNVKALREAEWKVLVLWECWTRNPEVELIPRLEKFFADS
jgi:DNA mismatch endonuclease, patch repair protein